MRNTMIIACLLVAGPALAGSNPFLAPTNPQGGQTTSPDKIYQMPIPPLPQATLGRQMPPADPIHASTPMASNPSKNAPATHENPSAWIVVGGVNGNSALLRIYKDSYGMSAPGSGAFASSSYSSSTYATPYLSGGSSMSQMGFASGSSQPQALVVQHGKFFWANGRRYRAWIEGNNVKLLVGSQVVLEAEPETPVPLGWTQVHGLSSQTGTTGAAPAGTGTGNPNLPGVR